MKSIKLWAVAIVAVAVAACSDNPTSIMDENDSEFSSEVSGHSAKVESGPSVTTDKEDYAPGQTVTVTGSGWLPGETVKMVLNENPKICNPRTISSVADENGEFVNTDFAPEDHDIGVEFTLVATGQTSGLTAEVVFTDGTISDATIAMRDAATCLVSDGPITLGSAICAYSSFTIGSSPSGTTHAQYRWKSPGVSGVVTAISQTSFGAGVSGAQTFNANYTPTSAGLWSVYLCQSNNQTTGTTGCASGSQKAVQTFLVNPSASNTPPTVDANGPYSGNQGQNISIAGTANDVDGNPLTYKWTYSGPGTCTFGDDTAISTTINCDTHGAYTLTLAVNDGIAPDVTDTASLTVINQAPSVDANGPYSGNEGSAINIAGTSSDPESDPLTYLWTYGIVSADAGASCSFGNAALESTTVTCTDDGTYTLTLAVNDGINADVTDNATLTVSNVAPSISITSPAAGSLYQVSQMVSVTAPFTDPGSNDTHTCTFDWDDYTSTGPSASTSPCSASHSYAAFGPGVFNIQVTATDDDGGSNSASVMIIVYDPSGGFVTGGGWIMSPAGAYRPDPNLSGKANFGFVSKYKKGATVPTGNTEFQFHAGSLNFHSENYEWLVVNKGGTNAQYKGTGTINGSGAYKFMLWATDGSPDKFRIKIWEESGGETVIYDNDGEQAIGGGSIVVHAGK